MKAIICKNQVNIVVNKIQDFIKNQGMIKSIRMVDHTEDQVVILISDDEIEQKEAEAWWDGYTNALGLH